VIENAPERLLIAMAVALPVFMQAANPLAQVCKLVPLGEMVGAQEGNRVFFPQSGLEVTLDDIERIHLVELETPGESTLSIEFAVTGDPRALILAAPGKWTDAGSIRRRICGFSKHALAHDKYETWCRDFTREPVLCPCCSVAAAKRRADPSLHPVAAIFHHALRHGMRLRCVLKSEACGLSVEILPGELDLSEGRISLTGADGTSHVSLDPGLCHAIGVETRDLDGEAHSMLRLYDQHGHLALEISTPGKQAAAVWCQFCK